MKNKMDIKEYREKLVKSITLPSGLVVKVKRLSPLIFLRAVDENGKHYSDLENLPTRDMMSIMVEAVAKMVIEPKIVKERTEESGDDCLLLDELYSEDLTHLIELVGDELSVFGKSFRTKK